LICRCHTSRRLLLRVCHSGPAAQVNRERPGRREIRQNNPEESGNGGDCSAEIDRVFGARLRKFANIRPKRSSNGDGSLGFFTTAMVIVLLILFFYR
jgi:hypothetical protein